MKATLTVPKPLGASQTVAPKKARIVQQLANKAEINQEGKARNLRRQSNAWNQDSEILQNRIEERNEELNKMLW